MTPKDVSKFFLKAVKDIIEYRENNNIKREDFMGILLNLKEQGKINAIDGIELRDENKNEGKFKKFAQSKVLIGVFFQSTSLR